MSDAVSTFIKIGIIVLLTPYWMPVVKALYDDFEAALWREGGLFGRPPTSEELAELEEKYRNWKSPLVNEPLARSRARRERR